MKLQRHIPLLPNEVPVSVIRSRPPERLRCFSLCQDGPLLAPFHLPEALCYRIPQVVQHLMVTTHRIIGVSRLEPPQGCAAKIFPRCNSAVGSITSFWAPLASIGKCLNLDTPTTHSSCTVLLFYVFPSADFEAVQHGGLVAAEYGCQTFCCPCCTVPETASTDLELGIVDDFPITVRRLSRRPNGGLMVR